MKFTIPLPLQHEHEALHERLRQATQAGGEVGKAAKTLAQLMHPHFVKEDQFALPPLGLLAALARGEWNAEMADVLTLTEQLEAELPQMLSEHQGIVAALNTLRDAAARAGSSDIVAFTEALTEHARTEEEVMYPAAVLVGQVVRQRLNLRVPAAA
jgi:hemerythrin-like domain-containing protein